MNAALKTLGDQLDAEIKTAEGYFAAAKTETDPEKVMAAITAAKAAAASVDATKAHIETLREADTLESGLAATKSWASTAQPMPQPGMSATAQLSGFTKAGQTVIDNEGRDSVLYQDGEGLLSEAQIKTIQNPDYASAFKSYLRNKGDIGRMKSDSIKALSEGIDEDGGFLVPAELLSRIIDRKPTPLRIASNTTQLTTGRDALMLPKNNYSADDIYTTGIRASWTGESGNPAQANKPQFGTFRIPIYTAMLTLNITNDLIEDSMFPLQSWVSDKFRETIDILKDNMALNGTGIGQPTGMLANVGKVDGNGNLLGVPFVKSGNASAVTADSLVAMAYAIPEQYLDNSKWAFNRTNTEAAIALLKDSQNRYLFSNGTVDASLATARPQLLLGFEALRSGLMPNVAANNFPILFGDLMAYYMVMRVGFTIRVLTEVQAVANQTVLLGRLRMGGDVAEPWRLRAMRIAA